MIYLYILSIHKVKGQTVLFSPIQFTISQCFVKLATGIEVDPQVPFSIATTPWGGRPFPWSVLLYP